MPAYEVTSEEAQNQVSKKRRERTRKVQGRETRENNRVLVTRIVTLQPIKQISQCYNPRQRAGERGKQ
jgi:hypothetical protein